MSALPDMNPVIDAIPGRSIPGTANMVGIGLVVLGILGTGYGFAVAGTAYTLGALLVSLVFFLGVSQGGVLFGVMLTGTQGRWGRSLKRIGETFAAFLPFLYILLVIFVVVGGQIYPWHPETIVRGDLGPIALKVHTGAAWASKETWYTPLFWMSRQVIGFAILILLDIVYIRASLRPDLLRAKARLGDKAPKWWDTIIGRHGDVNDEIDAGQATQSGIFGFVILAFVVTFTLMSMDLMMAMDPWWYANMFPGWIFMSSFWIGMSTLGLVAMVCRDWLGLKPFIRPAVTHDLGKLLLAACMFWAYTAYAQVLPIYYTNLTEEVTYLLLRLRHPAWSGLAMTVGALCFVTPFTILISRGIKKMRWPFAAICALILFGVFLERSLLVMPGVYFEDTFPLVNFVLVNFTIWLGFWGAFILIVGRVLAAVPPLVVSDPYLEPHPWDAHVHGLDHHH
jgi:hypothetical protein